MTQNQHSTPASPSFVSADILLQIANSVFSTTNLNNLCKDIYDTLQDIININDFTVALAEPETKDIHTVFSTIIEKNAINNHSVRTEPNPLSYHLCNEIIKSKTPLLLSDRKIVDFLQSRKLQAAHLLPVMWMGVPLIVKTGDGLLGVNCWLVGTQVRGACGRSKL